MKLIDSKCIKPFSNPIFLCTFHIFQTIILALEEVLGSKLKPDQREKVWGLLGIVLKAHIVTNFTYKQFCGVSAMVERLMCQEFSTSNRNNYKLRLQNFRPRAQGQ